jgi:hypothetical protein
MLNVEGLEDKCPSDNDRVEGNGDTVGLEEAFVSSEHQVAGRKRAHH